jgi:UDP-2-acetamido-3-amino-2,3-dideoxy-glucuronate N-acetyltransferase
VSDLVASDRAPGLFLAAGVEIPDDAVIGVHVVIHADVVLGPGVVIEDAVVLGKVPAIGVGSRSPRPGRAETRIGSGTIIGSHACVSVGATVGERAYIGDHSLVREGARLGDESSIGHACTISRDVTIGERVRMLSYGAIGPGVVIEDDSFVAPAVVMLSDGGPSVLRRGGRIGSGSQVMPGVEIGEKAVVGAGSVVTRDVPPGVTVVGVPARPLR